MSPSIYFRPPSSTNNSYFRVGKGNRDNSVTEGFDKSSENVDKSKENAFINIIQNELSESELTLINELKIIDKTVKAHENAHVAAGGQYITSGAQLGYTTGPDGKKYATSGEVGIDTSELKDPQATIHKMNIVRGAALAPVDPSAQDISVASNATMKISQAGAKIITLQRENNLNKYTSNQFKENNDETTINIVA